MNKLFTLILFLLPLGAMAQTVDLEKDSLLVNLPYGNVLNVLASQVPGFSISPVDNAEGDMSATMTLRVSLRRSVSRPEAASRTGAAGQKA